jgi:hypothetical protein
VAGDVVLKPEAGPVHEWLGTALLGVTSEDVRLAVPIRTREGSWACEGWSATRWVEGHEPDYADASTWIQIVEAGRAFHRAVAHLPRPKCLAERQDWWALADRTAWEERGTIFHPAFVDLPRRLLEAVKPLGPSQVIHGDLTGNVLFAAGATAAVVDISPYWRPPAYAEGIIVADALCWHSAPGSLLETVGVSVAAVARGLLFRMATTNAQVEGGAPGVDPKAEAQRYRLAAAAIGV